MKELEIDEATEYQVRRDIAESFAAVGAPLPDRLMVVESFHSPAFLWATKEHGIVLGLTKETATEWPVEQRRFVLAHEAAHLSLRHLYKWPLFGGGDGMTILLVLCLMFMLSAIALKGGVLYVIAKGIGEVLLWWTLLIAYRLRQFEYDADEVAIKALKDKEGAAAFFSSIRPRGWAAVLEVLSGLVATHPITWLRLSKVNSYDISRT